MSIEKSKFLPYGRQTLTESDVAAVVEVLRSPFLTQGPAVPEFEQSISSRVRAKHGVAVNSATSALHIACLALDLKPGILDPTYHICIKICKALQQKRTLGYRSINRFNKYICSSRKAV